MLSATVQAGRRTCRCKCCLAAAMLGLLELCLVVSDVQAQGQEVGTVRQPAAERQKAGRSARQPSRSSLARAVNVITGVPDMVDGAQAQATNQLNRFVYQLDDFFGAGIAVEDEHQSYGRIRLDSDRQVGEQHEFDGTVKLRVVLPRSEQRFRLLLSSEDDDDSLANTTAAGGEVDAEKQQNVSLALRFIRTAKENGSLNFDLGARMRDGDPQVFFRTNGSIKGDLSAGWSGRLVDNLYYYSKSGYENKISLDLRRSIYGNETLFFNSYTGFEWEQGRTGARIGATLGLYSNISDRMFIALEALAGYSTSLSEGESDRFSGSELRVRFRHNVWRPWFFYEIWPAVGWPSSNEYERAWGTLFRVEIEVGD